MNDSASILVRRCGGYQRLAEWCEVALHTVYRWTYPRARGGTDGLIPHRYHEVILKEAAAAEIAVTQAELLGVVAAPSDGAAAPEEAA